MPLTGKTAAIVSLGCDKNTVESERFAAALTTAGVALTNDTGNADVIIVNTCGFIAPAIQESLEVVAASKYEGKEGVKVVVAGCLTARKTDIMTEMPYVSAVAVESDDIVSVVCRVFGADYADYDGKGGVAGRVLSTPNSYGYLKIAEGCDNRCSYCAIPNIKGGYKSVPLDELLAEARALADGGVKELIIIAQDTALYGRDLYGENSLHDLLSELALIRGIERLRLLYCYPEHVYPALIDEIERNDKVCKYIDLPIQHADDGVLRAMGRSSTRESLTKLISELRRRMPDIIVRTTMLVGFPGESRAAFDELLSFVSETKFDRLGAFAYSREEGTAAYDMAGQVPEGTREARLRKLMETQADISAELNSKRVGKTYAVAIDGPVPHEKGVWVGRSYAECPEADGVVFVKSKRRLEVGETVNVHIEEADEYDLVGRVAE